MFFGLEVPLPDGRVQLRSVKTPDVLAAVMPAVVEAPQFRALVLGSHCPEVIAERVELPLARKHVLVPPGTSECGVEPVVLDRAQQVVARLRLAPRDGSVPPPDLRRSILHRGDHESRVADRARPPPVAVLQTFVEVVYGIDVHQRERGSRPEGP